MGCGSCVTTGTLKNGWTSAFVSSAHGSSGPDEAPAGVSVAPGDAVSTTPGPWLRSGTLLGPVPPATDAAGAADWVLPLTATGAVVAALPPHPAIANTTATRPADAVSVKRFMGFS
jgi:hypothetical protein